MASTDDVETEWLAETGRWLAIIVLILLSGVFSGLTLGLMSLDRTGLEIVQGGGNETLAKCARKIAPVRENGNLLLCTLLLGNVSVNSLLSVLLANMTNGAVGVILSTAFITIIGEILPQAVCSRYSLQIGSKAVGLVKVFLCLLYVFAKPLSMVLDYALGRDAGTIHSRQELMKLLQIHVTQGALDRESGRMVEGAIRAFNELKVPSVMTPIEDVFMLPSTAVLDYKTVTKIFWTGFSRIPVYGLNPNDIVGALFTKDLILVDPDDATPVSQFISIFGRGFEIFDPELSVGDAFRQFRRGYSHMALVRDVNIDGPGDPFYQVKGVVTLEDIVEEIVQQEIIDETDVYIDVDQQIKVPNTAQRERFAEQTLRLLNAQLLDEPLTDHEVEALTAHLLANVLPAAAKRNGIERCGMEESALKWVLRSGEIITLKSEKHLWVQKNQTVINTMFGKSPRRSVKGAKIGKSSPGSRASPMRSEGRPVVEQDLLPGSLTDANPEKEIFSRGVPADFCIIILTGRIEVKVGTNEFKSEMGSFSVLGADCLLLQEGEYVPDFTATIASAQCRCVRIQKALWDQGSKYSKLKICPVYLSPSELPFTSAEAGQENAPDQQQLFHCASSPSRDFLKVRTDQSLFGGSSDLRADSFHDMNEGSRKSRKSRRGEGREREREKEMNFFPRSAYASQNRTLDIRQWPAGVDKSPSDMSRKG